MEVTKKQHEAPLTKEQVMDVINFKYKGMIRFEMKFTECSYLNWVGIMYAGINNKSFMCVNDWIYMIVKELI
jgi:hypothetical protein